MVSESKLHTIRPRENSPFEIELIAKGFCRWAIGPFYANSN